MSSSKYVIKDYMATYGSIMQFNKNKNTFIHGWYPFVEGYSKDFILNIIDEFSSIFSRYPLNCLEPFCGSGTTPLELQKLNIKCTSFEVSPFMFNLSKVKLNTKYTKKTFQLHYNAICESLANYINDIETIVDIPKSRTIVEQPGLEKWNFNKEVMKGILDIKYSINSIPSSIYKNLFKIALASILLDVSNLYRNGKCLSYKKNWKTATPYSRTDVHKIYLDKLLNTFYNDICTIDNYKRSKKLFSNYNFCNFGDVRKLLDSTISNSSIDLIITSPPYLNSRDYTDTYITELRLLDYIKNSESLKNLRKSTLRSHVQIKWSKSKKLNIQLLDNTINAIEKSKDNFWNKDLLNMISGYFEDMNILFNLFYKKLIPSGMIFFNVANSAYYGIEVKTDEIIAQIAENNGFIVKELREARRINPSSQQKDAIPYLRESVLVIQKPTINM